MRRHDAGRLGAASSGVRRAASRHRTVSVDQGILRVDASKPGGMFGRQADRIRRHDEQCSEESGRTFWRVFAGDHNSCVHSCRRFRWCLSVRGKHPGCRTTLSWNNAPCRFYCINSFYNLFFVFWLVFTIRTSEHFYRHRDNGRYKVSCLFDIRERDNDQPQG